MSETARQADLRLAEELKLLQGELKDAWIDRSLPEGWNGVALREPVVPKKEKVTLRLDADMLRWFRKLGPGYNRRINAVLRIYWEALIAGRIKSHWDEKDVSVGFLEMIERMAKKQGENR
ncbi:BrnA antitoxin family protein [Alisedimentitalea sp. MJ-SS2]|uniref:BrnA antitoxin family protein n=1 Tax=Aliisedimentitalea sp. MJ-SS2 TaxID=3049795 RepID=UPI002913B7A8|nr:BrnA antitoxin family protein [Alisedimentitalea sp. MJ-SS2]MDU8929059.1 BrnA antitoxin family protein [Alisedimentitalea sp. MJ-SS2]